MYMRSKYRFKYRNAYFTHILLKQNTYIHTYRDTPETILPTLFNLIFKKWQKNSETTRWFYGSHTQLEGVERFIILEKTSPIPEFGIQLSL